MDNQKVASAIPSQVKTIPMEVSKLKTKKDPHHWMRMFDPQTQEFLKYCERVIILSDQYDEE